MIEFGDFGSASGPTGERCSEIVPGIAFCPVERRYCSGSFSSSSLASLWTSVVSLNPLNLLACRFHLDAGVLTELLPHLGHH